MKNPLSRTGSPSRINETRQATTTLAQDLLRAKARATSPMPAPLAALGLRALVSARSRGRRRATSLAESSRAVVRAEQDRRSRVAALRAGITSTHYRARYEQALDADRRHASVAHLTSWIPGWAAYLIAAAMLLSDPLFLLTTMRTIFDVSESQWLPTDVNVVLAYAMALGVPAIVLLSAHLAGRAFAALLFRGVLAKRPAEFPEARRSEQVLPVRLVLALGALGLVLLIATTVLLYQLAHERFSGGVAGIISGTGPSAAAGAVTAYITALPLAVLVVETVAAAPSFAHARHAARWSRQARRLERRTIRRDERDLARSRRLLAVADTAAAQLSDMIADVTARAQSEVIEAEIESGLADSDPVARSLGMAGPGREPAVPQRSGADGSAAADEDAAKALAGVQQPTAPAVDVTEVSIGVGRAAIDTSGRIRTGVQDVAVDNLVAQAFALYRAVSAIPDTSTAAEAWRALRESMVRPDSSRTAEPAPGPQRLHVIEPDGDDLVESAAR
ncbi:MULTISPECIES: hypothetical protein [unclassified Rathayibacter]|uniref:hypothetical protein n=1 Tax=unclassified Rathayibacter TaxID=2609250 RepID=UPI0006F4DD2A|nr:MULTISPECIES: hypothetical protein [unclassified Rathayibacter]KQQ06279.1 hypothetical protein ASF42_07150 [Rathayibacter sp. Leaf294]KQS14134.1 hypothetical protein ASG06_07150 [Rathayibacter sp. Leaf185]